MQQKSGAQFSNLIDLLLENMSGTDLACSDDFIASMHKLELSANNEHFYRDELAKAEHCTHIRFCIFPHGGLRRLPVYGERRS